MVPQKTDLTRMFRMFNRLPKGLDPMADIFRKHVEDEGARVCTCVCALAPRAGGSLAGGTGGCVGLLLVLLWPLRRQGPAAAHTALFECRQSGLSCHGMAVLTAFGLPLKRAAHAAAACQALLCGGEQVPGAQLGPAGPSTCPVAFAHVCGVVALWALRLLRHSAPGVAPRNSCARTVAGMAACGPRSSVGARAFAAGAPPPPWWHDRAAVASTAHPQLGQRAASARGLA